MVMKRTFLSRAADLLIGTTLTLLALSCLMPILHTLALSFSGKGPAEANWISFWPRAFTLDSYREVIKDSQFGVSFLISFERVVLGCAINFVLMVLTAFPLSHDEKLFPGRNIYMWFVLFAMLFSGGLIPSYMLISKLGLMDTLWALVLPGGVSIWNVILLMNYFRSLPRELEEACMIDGAGPWTIMARFYLPLSIPSLATVMLFAMVGHWNSFFDGLIYMNDPSRFPLQTYIYKLQMVFDTNNIASMSQEEISRMATVSYKTFNAAKICIGVLPLLLVYPFLQRYFVTGLVMGAVKG